MKTNYSYSAIKPDTIQSIGTPEKPLYQINFDTEEIQVSVDDESSSSGKSLSTQYRSIYVQVSALDYDTLVSAIIKSRYSTSDTEAIILNNIEALDATSEITDEKRSEYMAEYKALQDWRAHAKNIAGGIIV